MYSDTATDTSLWSRSLGEQSELSHKFYREKLSTALDTFRNNANILAKEIARDLPDFTVHDETHLDALWEMADIIAGPGYELNPIEAFVFGGAVLIHDLGMASAAYIDSVNDIKKGAEWYDALELAFRQYKGRAMKIDDRENPPEVVVKEAIGYRLRSLHAIHAEKIPFIVWNTPDGDSYSLIESQDLKSELGEIIGRIAASHWWPIEKVESELNLILGAPTSFPPKWTIDCLKIACILRVADAAHIDNRRAPGFLRAIRRPQGISDAHWLFQSRLSRPIVQNNLLTYNSTRAFEEQDMQAWWIAFDTLKMIDKEIKSSSQILKEKNRAVFNVQGVKGIDSPLNLSNYINVSGWEPVDLNIQVSDVSGLVKKLGGEALYGDNPSVPLRELIQNAADAIEARRTLQGLGDNWGKIVVSFGSDEKGSWIEVSDNGLGMSKRVLEEKLLDFGSSYWSSNLMVNEHPGLLSRGFESVGKYGIGFFSVFMWNGDVSVVSRSIHKGPEETYLLTLDKELSKRPLLKRERFEYLMEPGTKVRIYVAEEFITQIAAYFTSSTQIVPDTIEKQIAFICRKIAPSLKVNLYCKIYDNPETLIIKANDWKSIDNKSLLLRILGYNEEDIPFSLIKNIRKYSEIITPITDDLGEIIGRLGIIPNEDSSSNMGLMTCGGLYLETTNSKIIGIILGDVSTASRNKGIPLVSDEALASWADKQSELLHSHFKKIHPLEKIKLASLIHMCGGNTRNLPFCGTSDGFLTYQDIKNHEWGNEVGIVHDAVISVENIISLNKDIIAVSMGLPPFFYSDDFWPVTDMESFKSKILDDLLIRALAESWGCNIDDVIDASHLATDDLPGLIWPVGKNRDGEDIYDTISVIRRPNI